MTGNSRRNGAHFSGYLMRTENGQTVAVRDVVGLMGDSIAGWFDQMEAMAQGGKTDNYFYHFTLNPRKGEDFTSEQRDVAVATALKNLGLEDQPYFIVEHGGKPGRPAHYHGIVLRVDLDTGKAISDSNNYAIHMRTADELEKRFGHERTERGRGPDGPNPELHEVQRGQETGFDRKDVRSLFTELWRTTDSGKALAAAIEDHGFILAHGRRGYIAVDEAGDLHLLSKRVAGKRRKDIDARMADIPADQLPSVEEAKATARQRAKGKDGDDAPAQPGRQKRAAALGMVAEELAHAAAEALKGQRKGRPSEGAVREPAPQQEPASGGTRAGPAYGREPLRDDRSPGASAAAQPRENSAGQENPPRAARGNEERRSAGAAAPYEPATVRRRAPSMFERIAEMLCQARDLLDPGPTVSEAADRARDGAGQAEYGLAMRREAVSPDPVPPAPASTSTPFARLAQELIQEATAAAPIAENTALIAAAVLEPESCEGDRLTRQRIEALREAGGEANLLTSAGIDWRAQQAGIPYLPESPPEEDLTPFQRLTWERFSATRDNGGEPVTHDGQSFWQRAQAMLAAALDAAVEWARNRLDSFLDRLAHEGTSDRNDHERER